MAKKNKASTPQKRILIVDDHPMMREGLAQLIANENDLKVCGEAEDAAKALAAVETLKPDLVLVDITLGNKSGLEFIKDIKAVQPELPTLAISMHDENLYADRVLRAGGRGYIMKQEGGKMIMTAIRKVLSGQIYVSDKISHKILEMFSGKKSESNSSIENLTDREFEIFQLIGQGCETKDIASKLNISIKTVEVHRSNIKEKLKLKTVTELIRHAVRWSDSQLNGGSR
jgi:DNA-binding NarL/FixJ family response regulator